MICRGNMEDGVVAIAGAAAVEAVEANIEPSRIVLSARSACCLCSSTV